MSSYGDAVVFVSDPCTLQLPTSNPHPLPSLESWYLRRRAMRTMTHMHTSGEDNPCHRTLTYETFRGSRSGLNESMESQCNASSLVQPQCVIAPRQVRYSLAPHPLKTLANRGGKVHRCNPSVMLSQSRLASSPSVMKSPSFSTTSRRRMGTRSCSPAILNARICRPRKYWTTAGSEIP